MPENSVDDGPANVVVVLLDSLNRHMLGAYGGTEFETPNLDRFAARSTRFTSHVTGSLPCMPARHDILCGALDFLWKPWGSIELWEESITAALRRSGVTTMLASDHPHLFETGGENYHTDFAGWEYLRGHEGDAWRTFEDPTAIGAPTLPSAVDGGWFLRSRFNIDNDRFGRRHYDDARSWFRTEDDFPGPKTMKAASDWVRHASEAHDRWFLFIDEFDPHEPFDTPEPWASKYDEESWDGERLVWPPYAIGGVTTGALEAKQGRNIRNNYGAKMSMIDHHFGKLLDELDANDLWDTTAVIVCTDHGHYLGEERVVGAPGEEVNADIWGKPMIPQFEPLGHTPLMIHWPGRPGGGQIDALTTNVDLNATIADAFGVELEHRTHGESLVPLLTDQASSIRDWAIGGVFGNWVQVTDGRHKYARAPVGDNLPLSMWSNRWSTMPAQDDLASFMPWPKPDRRAGLDFMPGSDVPVIRQPFAEGDQLPYWAGGARAVGQHHLYDLGVDPDEGENRRGETTEAEMADLLRTALVEVEAPAEQLRAAGAGVTDAAKRIADQALEYVFNPPVASDRVIDYATPDELIVEFATTVGLGIDARSTTGVTRPAGRRGADDRRSVDAHDSPTFLQPELRWARTDRCGGRLVGRGAEYHERNVRGCPGLHHDGAFGHQQDGWLGGLPRRPCTWSAPARHSLSWRLIGHAACVATGTAPSLSRHSADRSDWRTTRRVRVPGRSLRHAQVSRTDGPWPAVRDRSRYRCRPAP